MKTNRVDLKTQTSVGASFSLSVFASFMSVCCISPFAVTWFGVGAAIAMARWQPYKPYLLIAALILLTFAFWNVYRSRKNCTQEACTTRHSLATKLGVWVSLVALLIAFFADDLQWLFIDPRPPVLQ